MKIINFSKAETLVFLRDAIRSCFPGIDVVCIPYLDSKDFFSEDLRISDLNLGRSAYVYVFPNRDYLLSDVMSALVDSFENGGVIFL